MPEKDPARVRTNYAVFPLPYYSTSVLTYLWRRKIFLNMTKYTATVFFADDITVCKCYRS